MSKRKYPPRATGMERISPMALNPPLKEIGPVKSVTAGNMVRNIFQSAECMAGVHSILAS
jgi:hypothetical protein